MAKDRFDKPPRIKGRVGAHRGARTKGLGWIWVAVAVVVAVGLTLGALRVLSAFIDTGLGISWLEQPTPTPTATETDLTPVMTDPSQLDPARGVTIRVLNGTEVEGLQDQVREQLVALGWPVLPGANAGERDIDTTVVYYSNPDDTDVANGLVAALGVGETQIVGPTQFPGAAITIVVGTDDPLVAQPTDSATDDAAGG